MPNGEKVIEIAQEWRMENYKKKIKIWEMSIHLK